MRSLGFRSEFDQVDRRGDGLLRIDVLVQFEAGNTPGWEFFDMQDELGGVLGRRVDLNTAGFLSRYFRERVLAEAETIYERA